MTLIPTHHQIWTDRCIPNNLLENWGYWHKLQASQRPGEGSTLSASHKTSSCIDLTFVNSALLLDFVDAAYLPSGLSDHSPLELLVCAPSCWTTSLWRLSPHWVSHPDLADNVATRLAEYWGINGESSAPPVTWHAFKANTRGQYISSITAIKSDNDSATCSLRA